ncbi:thiopeptide maturation pyridine synthase [Streptomyces lydicus]|uniref:thiopeptide maturation pyridine synthase n=1 Tax=Streptomyces lydicus TaxID=47763 RepID=UPI0009811021|nr:thiopeptide maturation pyridine synthase [Streptomyces lydicus]
MTGGVEASWHSLHVHHHDEAAEPELIREAVRPAFAGVRPWVRGCWFGRHWLRGPHLRLNFLTDETAWCARVRPVVRSVVTDYLRACPSTARLDEAALAPVHERLAELEMEPGPLRPWVPDNTVVERPYDHRLQVLGSLRASELMADFLSDTTDLAFRMYEQLRTAPLSVLALDLMWTTAAAAAIPFEDGGAPIERGVLSLRSHADAFLSRTNDPVAYRTRFDERFRRQEAALSARLREVEAALADPEGTDATGSGVAFVPEWARAVRRHQRIAQPLLASGEVSMGGAALAPRMPTRQLSEFHTLLLSDHGHQEFLVDDAWFASFRLVMNYLYLHLNRLGLAPVDRGLLCHLAARTVESVHGTSAIASFERYVAAPDGREEPGWRRIGAEWAEGTR